MTTSRPAAFALMIVALSPAAAAAAPITLDQARAQASERNETWEILRARVAQSRARLAEVEAALWPRLQADAAVTRNPEEVLIGDRVIQPLFNWSASAGASIVLFDGTVFPTIDAAKADVEALRADAQWRGALVELEVGNAWYALAAAQAQLELIDEVLALREADVARAEQLAAADRAVPLDVQRARADLLATEQRRIEAEAARDDASDALAMLIGAPVGEPLRAADGGAALGAPVALAPAPDAPLEDRADLAAAQRAIDAARLAQDAQAWAWWPTLGLSANALVGPPTLTRPDGFFWSVTLNTSWLIYDGGARLARADALAARAAELELGQSLRLRQERASLARARRAFDVASRSASVLDARAENAARALEMARARFSAGVASSLEVRDATAELLDVRSARLANRLRVHLARHQYDLLVGAPRAR